ncbi:MAG: signal recognition particle-docking protein FtsY [Candidatus Woesearchaeota archaeon]
MFKKLREKIKSAVTSLTKQAQKEEVVEKTEEKPKAPKKTKEVTPPPKQETKKEVKKKQEEATPQKKPESKEETKTEENKQEKTAPQEPEQKKKGFFTRLSEKVTTIQLSKEQFEELFWELELSLLENSVAVEVIEKIKKELEEELTTGRTSRGGLQERVYRRLEETLQEILDQPTINLLEETKKHKPLIIAAVGINGSGKTTTLAKLAHYFKKNNKTVLLAAADTFRAAAIQQLQEHANKLEIPIIKQDYGSDAAAVAYDAVQAATARNIDVVLIDTAGRLHSNKNLMDELEKVMRVSKPHHTIFVGEATTGNDCVEQARLFAQKTSLDAIILTKADVDEQGGAAISTSYVTKKPILFLGVGQGYDDLEEFSKETIIKNLLQE